MSIRSKIVAVVVACAALLPLVLASCSDDPSPVSPTNDASPPPSSRDTGACVPSFPDVRWKNLTPAEAGLAHVREISFDRDGRIYAVGEIEGRVDFGTGPLSDQGPNVTPFYFVFDKDGKPIGGSVIEGYSLTDESRISVAAFPDGGAIVTANLSGGTPGSIFGGQMLLRIDANATLVWQKLLQASMRASVGLGPDGNIVFAGALGRKVDLDGCMLVAHNFVGGANADAGAEGGADAGDASASDAGKQSELPDVFLATLDPKGHCIWGKTFGSPAIEGASAVRRLGIDAEGNIVIAGEMSGAVDFGGGVLAGPPIATSDSVDRIQGSLFLAKLSKTGELVWNSMFGDEVRQQRRVTGLAVAPDGAIALTSYFIGNGDFGKGPFNVDKSGAATLAMFDASGQTTFAMAFTRASTGAITSVAADAKSSFHAVGFVTTSDTVEIGDFRVSRPDESSILVTSFTRQGALTKSLLFDNCDRGSVRGYAIAVAPSGELVVAGALGVTNPAGPLIGTTALLGVTP